MKVFIIQILFLFTLGSAFAVAPTDSIGTKSQGDKIFTVHKVEKGETLYALSRKYKVSVDAIKSANKGKVAMNVGQKVLIPTSEKTSSPKVANPKVSVASHTVGKGETLYAISRKYGVSVTEIKKLNSLTSNEVAVDQVLLLKKPSGKSEVKTTASQIKTHTVAKGEGLYGIAKKYNLSVTELKSLNGLTSDNVSVGQVLKVSGAKTDEKVVKEVPEEQKTHIVAKGEGLFSIAKKYDVEVGAITKANNLTSSSLKVGQKLIIPSVVATDNLSKIEKDPSPHLIVDKPVQTEETKQNAKKKYERITEIGKGVKKVSENLNSKYSYCFHHAAPIGAVIKITNAENGYYVFARVVGKFSKKDTTVIWVNSTVADRLEIKESEFSVKISYVK